MGKNQQIIASGFPERLKAARLRLWLTQKELAEKAGVAVRSVQLWEQGVRLPRFDCMRLLAEALGCPAHILAGIVDKQTEV